MQFVKELTSQVFEKLMDYQNEDLRNKVIVNREKEALKYIRDLKLSLFPGIDDSSESESEEEEYEESEEAQEEQ